MMKKRYMPEIFNIIKLILFLIIIIIQILTIYIVINYLDILVQKYYFILEMIGALIALKILSSSKKYIYKLSWTIFLVVLPLPAVLFYILFGDVRFTKKVQKYENEIIDKYGFKVDQNLELLDQVKGDLDTVSELTSIYRLANCKVYETTDIEYFDLGEDFFFDVIEKIKKAKKFIFIEFYILARGELYNEVKDALIDKAKKGVEVKIIYDGMGSIGRFFKKDVGELQNNNIEIVAFNNNPASIFKYLNYRTHRKIVVVDGEYAYTGGNNLADEYVNKIQKYGHWKDMGIRVSGSSTHPYIKSFIVSWCLVTKKDIDVSNYFKACETKGVTGSNAIVVPFTDGPTSPNNVAQHNYMKIISNAKKYVYITTPYLIIDEEMITCLTVSAKSGVDVKILVPGIADKKLVYEVTKSHFKVLIDAGVKIYTYTPGFVHGKTIVSDDRVATVGSINFDFRSLLWNYECGIYVSNCEFAKKVKEDFNLTIEKSKKVNEQYLNTSSIKINYIYGVLKLLGPLM